MRIFLTKFPHVSAYIALVSATIRHSFTGKACLLIGITAVLYGLLINNLNLWTDEIYSVLMAKDSLGCLLYTSRVETAVELTAAQDKKLRSVLETKLKAPILLEYTVKPEVLGGLRVRFKSFLIDDTLESKLGRIGQLIKSGSQ